MKKRRFHLNKKLEVYAFWTGFASTIISLLQVLVLASRSGG
jgi:hypothetical protein